MSWFEVETKVALEKKEAKIIKERIKKIARFKKRETKVDEYFAIQKDGYPKKAFRIRKKGKDYEINFKIKRKEFYSKDIVVKEEYEFKIENPKNFIYLMKDLGFLEWIKKIKHSETYTYIKDPRGSIEFNFVEKLGYFLEIEYLCSRKEINKAKNLIHQILNDIGIKPKEINNIGYTKMLWEKGVKR